ncbi:MAG: hypothetical protein WAT39_22960, partial [Planctomycetota bacterium]
PPVRRPLWPWLLAAAALLLTVALAFHRPRRGPEGHDGEQLGAMWAAAFEHADTNGFGTGACCDGGLDLAGQCEQRFAVKLFGGRGMTVHGCYCGLSTGGCVAALAQSGDERIAVFVLPRDQDPGPCLPAGCPLHLARRELGPLVLYAVSRAPEPMALAQFALGP